MSPPSCPKSGRPVTQVPVVIDDEGVTICPGCARVIVVAGGRIREHALPGRGS